MQSSITDNLNRAIEGLYSTFSRYPAPEYAPHSVPFIFTDEDIRLFSTPLRQLGPQEIRRFAFKAMTTWGSEDDFRHFLPRIFELIARDGGGDWIDPEVVFGKLSYGNWRTWPSDEQEAVTVFFQSLWSNVLAHFPNEFNVDSSLCSIAQALDDLTDFLKAWRISESLSSARHFTWFLEENGVISNTLRFGRGILNNSWWDSRPTPAAQVNQWLMDPARARELEQAFFAFKTRENDMSDVSQALEMLLIFQSRHRI